MININTMLSYCATPFVPQANSLITQLNLDPNGIIVLLQHPELIRWDILPYNHANYHVYARYPSMISWTALKQNPILYTLMRKNISQIDWSI